MPSAFCFQTRIRRSGMSRITSMKRKNLTLCYSFGHQRPVSERARLDTSRSSCRPLGSCQLLPLFFCVACCSIPLAIRTTDDLNLCVFEGTCTSTCRHKCNDVLNKTNCCEIEKVHLALRLTFSNRGSHYSPQQRIVAL